MGQGNQVCRHQGGVIRAIATKYSVTPVPRMAVCQRGVSPNGSIQNDSGLTQGPADRASGRLKGAAKRLSRNSP
jgi:hypothetical protein